MPNNYTRSEVPPLPLSGAPLALVGSRCPRCDDALTLLHTFSKFGPVHYLGCLSFPRCSYTAPYDARLHEVLSTMHARLVRMEAQYAWLLCQVEELFDRLQEVTP